MNPDWQLLLLENRLWVLSAPTGIPIYDFDLRAYFRCASPGQREAELTAIARIGAFEDFDATYAKLLAQGVRLIHSTEEHRRASQLPGWCPRLQDLTPRSRWFDHPPSVREIEQEFSWPIFLKGIRQTSRHRRSLSIIHSPEQYKTALDAYREDSILRWQPLVVREYVPLRSVEDSDASRVPASFEFRTFWFHGQCVGAGRYWWEGRPYKWTDEERRAALALGSDAARRIDVPFAVLISP
jgi:hypothetical protein